MTPQQILPAIPRQKVRNKITGRIGDVIYTDPDCARIVFVKIQDGTFMGWAISECEPVPEEPRVFRVGDKAFFVDKIHGGEYSTISSITHNGCMTASGNRYGKEFLRHCSKEEEARYFN